MPGNTRFILLLSCGLRGEGMKNLGTCLYGWVSVDSCIYIYISMDLSELQEMRTYR